MHGPPGQRPRWGEMFWLRGGAVCEGMNVAESPGRGSSGDAGSTRPASWGWVSKTRPDLSTGPRAQPEDRDRGSREACRPWLLWEGTTPLSPWVALVSFRGFSATWLWTLAARFLQCHGFAVGTQFVYLTQEELAGRPQPPAEDKAVSPWSTL